MTRNEIESQIKDTIATMAANERANRLEVESSYLTSDDEMNNELVGAWLNGFMAASEADENNDVLEGA